MVRKRGQKEEKVNCSRFLILINFAKHSGGLVVTVLRPSNFSRTNLFNNSKLQNAAKFGL